MTSVGILSGSSLIVTASADRTLRTWEADTGQAVSTLRAHTSAVTCLTTDPAARWFASGGEDGTVRIWRVETGGRRRPEQVEHDGPVTAFAPLPGGGMASASEDQTIRIWDADGRPAGVLRGHVGPVTCLLAAGDRLVSGSSDHTVRAWRLDGSRKVEVMGKPLAGLAQRDREAEVIGGQRTADGHAAAVNCLTSLDGTRLLSAGSDGTVRLWNMDEGRQLAMFEPASGTLTTLVAHEGVVFAAGTAREITGWRLSDGRIQQRLVGHESSVTCLVTWGRGGANLASGSLDGTVRVWSPGSGLSHSHGGHQGRVSCLVADQESNYVASGGEDGRVLIWQPARMSAAAEGARHDGAVRVIVADGAFSRLASAGDDGWVRVWDIRRGEMLASASVGAAVSALRFSGPSRLWVGTRAASVTLLQLEPGAGR